MRIFTPVECSQHKGYYKIPGATNYAINKCGVIKNLLTDVTTVGSENIHDLSVFYTLTLNDGTKRCIPLYNWLKLALYGNSPVICCYDINLKLLYQSNDIVSLGTRIKLASKPYINRYLINKALVSNVGYHKSFYELYGFIVYYQQDTSFDLATIKDKHSIESNDRYYANTGSDTAILSYVSSDIWAIGKKWGVRYIESIITEKNKSVSYIDSTGITWNYAFPLNKVELELFNVGRIEQTF